MKKAKKIDWKKLAESIKAERDKLEEQVEAEQRSNAVLRANVQAWKILADNSVELKNRAQSDAGEIVAEKTKIEIQLAESRETEKMYKEMLEAVQQQTDLQAVSFASLPWRLGADLEKGRQAIKSRATERAYASVAVALGFVAMAMFFALAVFGAPGILH